MAKAGRGMAGEKKSWGTAPAPKRLYRVAFSADVGAFTDWRWQRGAGRWDDPRIAHVRATIARICEDVGAERAGELFEKVMREGAIDGNCYRVVYSASGKTGAMVEALRDFRRSTTALSRGAIESIRSVIQDAPDIAREPDPAIGVVPAEHVGRLYVGAVDLEASAPFVDVEAVQSVQRIRSELLYDAQRQGFRDVSLGAILGENRNFTQLIAKLVYDDPQRFAGISHRSTHGHGDVDADKHVNFAVFESPGDDVEHARAVLRTIESERVQLDDPHLAQAIALLGLELEGAGDVGARRVDRDLDLCDDRELGR